MARLRTTKARAATAAPDPNAFEVIICALLPFLALLHQSLSSGLLPWCMRIVQPRSEAPLAPCGHVSRPTPPKQ